MFTELQCVTNFILFYISLNLKGNTKSLTSQQATQFKIYLEEVILNEYRALWDENFPLIGSFYRILSMTHQIDPLIWSAWNKINRSKKDLKIGLKDITIWVNPLEVQVKLNKSCPILTIYSKQENIKFDVIFPNPPPSTPTVNKKYFSFRKYLQTLLNPNISKSI